jgi:hypothetical protein
MKRKSMMAVRWGFLALLLCILSCLGMGAGRAPNQGQPTRPPFKMPTSPEGAAASRVDYYGVDASLVQREDAEFLLTPALLVQEAVSDGIVLTYPEE